MNVKKVISALAAVSMLAVSSVAMAAEYDAETNTATYAVPTADDGTQMTVLVIPEGAKGNVTDSDILYIYQDEKGGSINGSAPLIDNGGSLADGKYLAMVGYYEDATFKIAEEEFTVGGTEKVVIAGDANQDNKISPDDAALILRATSKGTVLDKDALAAAAGADGNTRLSTNDATEVLRYVAKNTTEFVGTDVTVAE